jgi:type VI secretion system secreted protein VgrG
MVDVDVTGLPAGTGTVTITVNWVDRMRAGLASSGNLVIICTRAWWQNESTANQNQVMIHEIGHMFGMVADGSGKLPNQTAKQYSARGHRGSHCYSGLTLRATFASGSNSASDCVMFGSTNGKAAFCSHCAPAVRKIDICDGWPRF